MTLVRAGNTLHILTDHGVPCGTSDDWKVRDEEERVGRDDLICGRCLDLTSPVRDDVPFSVTTELAALPYNQYLRTHHWQTIRRAALDHYGPACLLCGETGQVDVHHRTYARRGEERLHDLAVLCRPCHKRFHTEAA